MITLVLLSNEVFMKSITKEQCIFMRPKSWTFNVSTAGRRAIAKKGFRAVEDLNTHEMITITFP